MMIYMGLFDCTTNKNLKFGVLRFSDYF